MAYNNIWTAHLQDPEEKQRFLNQLHGSRDVLDRLSVMIDEKLETLEESERGLAQYTTTNWSHLQAHKNGYASAMKVLQKLLPDQERS